MNKKIQLQNFKSIKISQLKLAPWNYKEDDEEMTIKLMNNLEKNGQVLNIVVRQLMKNQYEVVDGNHRLEAVKRLNWNEVLCYDCGKVSKEQAIEIAIGINEIRFPTEIMKLAENLHILSKKISLEEMTKTLPYNIEELKNMLNSYQFNWEELEKEVKEKMKEEDNNKKEIQCPKCGHKFKVE